MFRSSLLEVLGQDYIEALRARGIPPARLYLHAFRNTLPSLLTVAGLQLGYLLGGVIFVEAVFSWPGIGLLVFQSISQRDLPLIQAGAGVGAGLRRPQSGGRHAPRHRRPTHPALT